MTVFESFQPLSGLHVPRVLLAQLFALLQARDRGQSGAGVAAAAANVLDHIRVRHRSDRADRYDVRTARRLDSCVDNDNS